MVENCGGRLEARGSTACWEEVSQSVEKDFERREHRLSLPYLPPLDRPLLTPNLAPLPSPPLAGLLAPLASGSSVILPKEGKFTAHVFWHDCCQHGATFYTAVPTMHQV